MIRDINDMKRILFVLLVACLAQGIDAQPAAKRKEQQQQAVKSNANNVTERAKIMFPIMAPMKEDVVWRRDIYRELSLEDDANAGLYYPVEPVDGQMNLFTYIFKLMLRGQVKVYEYRLDGNEVFTDSARVSPKAFIDNYHIYYEKTSRGGIRIDDSDIPSREVKAYYVKEAAYYDQATSSFHTKVLALCPIMLREDDFGDGTAKYPLFWVKYDDLAPFLTKQTIMTSNLNNAAVMSIDDYFTLNKYKGKIYKTTNMLGRTLAQYCPTDSAMAKEQKRIEKELKDFEKGLWGNQARKDSLDSIAKTKELTKGGKKVKSANNRRTSGSTAKPKKTKSSSGGGSSSARVTVRRERH